MRACKCNQLSHGSLSRFPGRHEKSGRACFLLPHSFIMEELCSMVCIVSFLVRNQINYKNSE